MLKTVKVKKQLRLDELIKYVWENRLYPIVCFREGGGRASVIFGNAGSIEFGEYSYGTFRKGDTFTVEVEEEIDYDTVFEEVYRVTKEGEVTSDKNKSIGECLDWKDYQVQIFAMIYGKLELIWEAE